MFDFAYIAIENATKDNEKRNYSIGTVVIKIYAEVPEINLDFTVKYYTLLNRNSHCFLYKKNKIRKVFE